jgi:hypothetical protein
MTEKRFAVLATALAVLLPSTSYSHTIGDTP